MRSRTHSQKNTPAPSPVGSPILQPARRPKANTREDEDEDDDDDDDDDDEEEEDREAEEGEENDGQGEESFGESKQNSDDEEFAQPKALNTTPPNKAFFYPGMHQPSEVTHFHEQGGFSHEPSPFNEFNGLPTPPEPADHFRSNYSSAPVKDSVFSIFLNQDSHHLSPSLPASYL